ncbi:MAG TPA: hypothetical protein VIC62_04215, partial [Nakamurella sp.]
SRDFVGTLLKLVEAKVIPQERIDDAVTRILTKKFELGLFEHPFADRTHIDQIGSPRTATSPARPSPSRRCC